MPFTTNLRNLDSISILSWGPQAFLDTRSLSVTVSTDFLNLLSFPMGGIWTGVAFGWTLPSLGQYTACVSTDPGLQIPYPGSGHHKCPGGVWGGTQCRGAGGGKG